MPSESTAFQLQPDGLLFPVMFGEAGHPGPLLAGSTLPLLDWKFCFFLFYKSKNVYPSYTVSHLAWGRAMDRTWATFVEMHSFIWQIWEVTDSFLKVSMCTICSRFLDHLTYRYVINIPPRSTHGKSSALSRLPALHIYTQVPMLVPFKLFYSENGQLGLFFKGHKILEKDTIRTN